MAAPSRRDPDGSDRIRLDKWLWHARFCRSRSIAREEILAGHVRVDGQRSTRPGRLVGPGAVLTLAIAGHVRVVRLRATGQRRGPAEEARGLYDDLAPEAGGAPPRPHEIDAQTGA